MSEQTMEQRTGRQMVVRSEEAGLPVRAYSPLQAYFLLRLARLVQLQKTLSGQPEETKSPALVKAVRHVVFSTFCDCADLGAGGEARALLKGEKAGC